MEYLELADYFEYLDELRESGVTNMYSAPSYLKDRYGMSAGTARSVVKAWMDTFDEDEDLDDRVLEAQELLEVD